MSALLWAFAATLASGAPVDQRFRVGHEVNLLDATGGGEDFFTTNDVYAARFAFVALYEEPGHSLVAFHYTDDNGYVLFEDIDDTAEYTLELFAAHDVFDSWRDFYVKDSSGNIESALSGELQPNSTPTQINTLGVIFTADPNVGQQWVNAAAIGSWVMYRRPGAFPTYLDNHAEYVIEMEDPSTGCANATQPANYCQGNQKVFLDPNDPYAWQRKFIIAHEFAHEAQHWNLVPTTTSDPTDYFYLADYNAGADAAHCQDAGAAHDFYSYEYQSSAIIEGMAHYLAAVAFNDTTEEDCRFDPAGGRVWVEDIQSSDDQFSCEGYPDDIGGIEWTGYDIPGNDFFHFDYDEAGTNYEPCSDSTDNTNRAIELDWLRFLWDADNKGDLDTADIFVIWITAAPAGGGLLTPWSADDSGGSSAMPRLRMNNGFILQGFEDVWDDWAAYNGVDQ
jgi:hypothetical protein